MNQREAEILRSRFGGAYSKAVPKETTMFFDGATYNHARDSSRLGDQMASVLSVMTDGKWRTLSAIASETNAPEASVSARLRDLRKKRFGGHTVNREFLRRGLFQYQLVVSETEAA